MKLFDRPIDFSYNADLNSLALGLKQVMDHIEANHKPAAKPRKKKVAAK